QVLMTRRAIHVVPLTHIPWGCGDTNETNVMNDTNRRGRPPDRSTGGDAVQLDQGQVVRLVVDHHLPPNGVLAGGHLQVDVPLLDQLAFLVNREKDDQIELPVDGVASGQDEADLRTSL